MDYAALITRLTRRGLFRIKPGLERTREVLQALGNPQDTLKVIHIAGTNGKGSVAACLESVLRRAGQRTGLYTSPHLWDVRERIQIDRQPIGVATFWNTAQRVLSAEQRAGGALTYFEFLTVMAFEAFERAHVDVAIIETGLGGRWDATNVLAHPLLTLITSIGLDHVEWLGKTEAAIAREKAGIFKTGSPVISGARGPAARTLATLAARKNATFKQIDADFSARVQSIAWPDRRQTIVYTGLTGSAETYTLDLLGDHQADNAAVALAGLETLAQNGWAISQAARRDGLADTRWPGRFQFVQAGRLILLDGAHNVPALQRVLALLKQSPWAARDKTFVFGVYRDKDYPRMLALLKPHAARIIVCTLPGKRALPAQKSAAAAKRHRSLQVVADPHKALQAAVQASRSSDLVVVTGSLALVGLLLQDLATTDRENRADLPPSSLSKGRETPGEGSGLESLHV